MTTFGRLPGGVRTRTSIIAGALLVSSIAASHFTAFRTHVRLVSDRVGLSLTVNGRTIRGGRPAGPVRAIRIDTFNSVFPMGGETLTLRQGSRTLLQDRLPQRFQVSHGPYEPLGDWSLDPPAGSGTVYERSVLASGDFTLEATFTGRCVEYTSIVLASEPIIRAQFRRGLLNNDFVLNVGDRVVAVDALISPLPQMGRDVLDLVLHGIISGCALVLLFEVARSVLSRRRKRDGDLLTRTWSQLKSRWPAVTALGLTLISLGIRLWMSRSVLEGLPHTPDEVAYMLQAKWMLADRLYQAPAPIAEYLSVPFTYVRDGKWFAMYPIGWPLILAIGEGVGLPWIVSPICGALYVFLLYLIGKELYGEVVGLAAAVLATFSPMAILMSASFLSHASAALLIALFLWLHLVGRRRRSPWIGALSGVSLGFAFSIRPVTAIAVAVPFALLLLGEVRRSAERPDAVRRSVAFILGGLAGSAPVLISNHMITGHALSFAYGWGANVSFSWKNLPLGLMYLDATAASVIPATFGWGWGVLSGWPILSLTLAFACAALVLGRARPYDVFLAVFLVTLPLSFVTWGFHGLHGYGPRFYFEALLGLYLLTAYGFLLLAGIDAKKRPVQLRSGRGVAMLALGLFSLLTFSTVATLLPRLNLYKSYNGVNRTLENEIARQGLRKALIVLADGDWFPWGAASNLLNADLHADLAFAASQPDNRRLLAFYPDRPVYVWSRDRLTPSPPPLASPIPPIPTSPASPARMATFLGWWLSLSAFAAGAMVLLTRRSDTPATPAVVPPSAASPPRDRPAETSADLFQRPEVPLLPVRPMRAAAGLVSAYLGQALLTPGALLPPSALAGLSERQLFHAGWILLLVGAVLFGTAWPSFRLPRRTPIGPPVGARAGSAEPAPSTEKSSPVRSRTFWR